jgi:tetratricopeptide (TPR) repeat protein
MTMRLDIVTGGAGELVRREHARELGAGVVVALYRLARVAQLHDLGNEAFLRQLEGTHALVRDYCLRAGADVNVLFAQRAVFVAGQLLKGSRSAYESAAELGDILERCGGSELTIERDVSAEELRSFAEAVSAALQRGKAFRSPSTRIRLRPVTDAARLRGLDVEDLPFEQRVVRAYASAVVIMRRLFEDLRAGRYMLPRRVKRVAQTIVDLSEGSTPAFLGVLEARNANHDDAGRAVNAAILAVATAREISQERAQLAQIAMAALMHDVARPRAVALASSAGHGAGSELESGVTAIAAKLTEEAEDRLPAGTAAVLTALGRVNEPTITRTVVAYEAQWVRRAASLGPAYRGVRAPTLQAKIVAVARRYNDLLTPEPGLAPPASDFAIATLAEELTEPADRTVLRMLVSALGLFPIGTVVELATGEVGEVVTSGGRPRLRLVMGARGEVLDGRREIDLAGASIAKTVSVDGWKKGLAAGASATPSRAPSAAPPTFEEDEPGSTPSEVAEAVARDLQEAPPPSRRPAQVPTRSPPALDAAGRGRMAFSVPPAARARTTAELVPTAKGATDATPLVHILVYVLDHALSGTTVLREPSGAESSIYFLEGAPAKVKTHAPVAVLGDELVRMGLASQSVVTKALASAQRLGVLLGEYLVGNGILTDWGLQRALGVQLRKKVASLTNLDAGTEYAFYRDVNTLDGWAGERLVVCHPLDVVLAAARAWYDRARIHATLGRIENEPLAFHPDVDLSALDLTHEEEKVLAVLRAEGGAPPSFQALLQQRVADEDAVSSLVYALAVTRQFAFAGQKGEPMGRSRAYSDSGEGDRASGLPFSAVVEPRHPSSGRHPAAEPLRSIEVMVEMDEEEEKTDQPTRAADQSVERALQGMRDFRQAEIALQRGDLEGAARLAESAAQADPEQVDYVALLAWARAMGGAPNATADGIDALTRLLGSAPKHERALLYRGLLLKRAGRDKDALRDFTRVLELNPKSSQAASEVRMLKGRLGGR